MTDRLRHDDDDMVRIAHAIAALDLDARLAATVNGLMIGCRGDIGNTIHRLVQCVVTLAAMIDDHHTNLSVVKALHETADLFEKSRVLVNNDHALH